MPYLPPSPFRITPACRRYGTHAIISLASSISLIFMPVAACLIGCLSLPRAATSQTGLPSLLLFLLSFLSIDACYRRHFRQIALFFDISLSFHAFRLFSFSLYFFHLPYFRQLSIFSCRHAVAASFFFLHSAFFIISDAYFITPSSPAFFIAAAIVTAFTGFFALYFSSSFFFHLIFSFSPLDTLQHMLSRLSHYEMSL